MTTRFFALSIAALAALMPACTSLKTVHVRGDSIIANSSVEVDIVKSSPAVQTISVRDYFQPGNTVRSNARPTTVRFGSGQIGETVVPKKNWGGGGVTVLADIPGISDAPGDADARRKTIPGSGKGVKSNMQVLVTPSGVNVTPLP